MPGPITISGSSSGDVTTISNVFFDEYLPRANGEFLKIYLYLVRWFSGNEGTLSLSGIADVFLMTETDVIRALRYWEQEGLLKLACDSEGTIMSIRLEPVRPHTASDDAVPAQSGISSSGRSCDISVISSDAGEEISDDDRSGVSRPAVSACTVSYPMSELESFASEEGRQLIFIIQQYLGHPLGQTDLNLIYYFYDELGFSSDLIEYLFEYCVSEGHPGMRYIEKVALSWAQQNVTTPEQARAQARGHNRDAYAVLKAYGIGGRMPAAPETEYVNKWTQIYGFDMDLILEACRRTIMAVHTPSFEYTDKILSNWKDQGYTSLDEIRAADQERETSAASSANSRHTSQGKASSRNPSGGNKFHNFTQRSYDYDDLEQKFARKARNVSGDDK